MNLYSYSDNSPSTKVDPAGLQSGDPLDAEAREFFGAPTGFQNAKAQGAQDLGVFGKFMLWWAATFGPGKIGQAATAVDLATESSEGDGLPLPFISGATGVLANLLKSQKKRKQLQSLLKKHLSAGQNFDCAPTAVALKGDLEKIGIPAKYLQTHAAAPGMFVNGAGEKFSDNGWHVAVQIGDRVFDKLTGPKGLPLPEYKKFMARSSERPIFDPTDFLPEWRYRDN